jgi:uncharacterized protein YbdZ (MbtH family)
MKIRGIKNTVLQNRRQRISQNPDKINAVTSEGHKYSIWSQLNPLPLSHDLCHAKQ